MREECEYSVLQLLNALWHQVTHEGATRHAQALTAAANNEQFTL